MTVGVGVIGTSWWADAMYLPALDACADATTVALMGRDAGRAEERARQWGIERWTVDLDDFLATPGLDAVIVASANDSHHPLASACLDAGLALLCEKPLATTAALARDLADRAAAARVVTAVPFTYRHMPSNRWFRQLVAEGWLGRTHRMSARYFAGFALDGEYSWRFDPSVAGAGILGDLGSHWLDLAIWMFGEVTELGCVSSRLVERDPRPDGAAYEASEDHAVMQVRFASGAQGTLEVTAVAWEGDGFGQVHELDAHGDAGTLHSVNDWVGTQQVSGLRRGEPGRSRVLPIPEDIWGNARRSPVHDTYRDVFRGGGAMVGEFVTAVAGGARCDADFAMGARISELIELAERSAREDGRMLDASGGSAG